MDYANSLALLFGVYAISLVSPGPNFIVVTRTSMSASRAAGLFAGFGLALASLTWAMLAITGLGLVLSHFRWLHTVVQVAGALYLIWLGVKMVRHAAAPLEAGGTGEVTWRAAMRNAFVVSMTNPKSVAFFGSVFALAIPSGAPLWFYALVVVVTFCMSLAWYCGLALFFSDPRVARRFTRFKAWIERVMGTALILLGGRLLLAR